MGLLTMRQPARLLDEGCLCLLMLCTALVILTGNASAEDEAPPLEVTSPEDGLLTNNSILLVTGTTAPGAEVIVTVERVARPEIYYETTAGADGRFEVGVGLFEGLQGVNVTAIDGSGRTNNTFRTVRLDTVPPSFDIASPPRSPYHTRYSRYVIICSFPSPDPILYVWVQDIFVPESDGVFKVTVNLTEGENVINIRVRDTAGNEAVKTVVIIVDFTPPALDIIEPADRNVSTNRTTLHLAGNVSGATRVVVVYRDVEHNATLTGGDWDAGGGWECDLDLGQSDGTWSVKVRALDAVGNEVRWDANVALDRVPPVLVFDPALPKKTERAGLSINGTTEPGIRSVRVNKWSAPIINGRFAFYITMKEGPQRIVVEVQDAAGNRAVHEAVVMFDGGDPRLEVEALDRTWDARARVRGQTDDNVKLVFVNGRDYPVVNGSFDVEVGLRFGRNALKVVVVDPAGNEVRKTVVIVRGVSGVDVAAIAVLAVGAVALVRPVARFRRELATRPRKNPLPPKRNDESHHR